MIIPLALQVAALAVVRILAELSDAPELAEAVGRQFRSFTPQSGHPTGFYMANLVEEEFGPEVFRDVVRNPFKFFAL